MMGPRQIRQSELFYEFSLDRHVPMDHLLRSIDRVVDLSDVRRELAPFYSSMGRPSVDPELMIRMLLVGGEGFAVDGSLIKADANRQRDIEGDQWVPPETTRRAVDEYLAVLDDAAFGAATDVSPKFISPSDPAARWTGAHGGLAFFAYSANI